MFSDVTKIKTSALIREAETLIMDNTAAIDSIVMVEFTSEEFRRLESLLDEAKRRAVNAERAHD